MRVILPFDEETSSADQSSINSKQLASDSVAFNSYPLLVNNKDIIYDLRQDLCKIRRLIRIKMADQADYYQVSLSFVLVIKMIINLTFVNILQAVTALKTLTGFLGEMDLYFEQQKEKREDKLSSISNFVNQLDQM